MTATDGKDVLPARSFVRLTCAADGQAHAVWTDDIAVPNNDRPGLPAFCKHLITVVAEVLLAPPGPHCAGCDSRIPPGAIERRPYPEKLARAHEMFPSALVRLRAPNDGAHR